MHRQDRGGVQSGFVPGGVDRMVGAVVLRCGERQHAVRNPDVVQPLGLDPFDAERGAVSRDVVLEHGHGGRGSRTQRHLVVARVHSRIRCGWKHAYADLRLGALPGPILDGIGERVGACGIGVGRIHEVIRADLVDASQ